MSRQMPPQRPSQTERRCEVVAMPRDDQGVVNSLARAFAVEALPDDMRMMLARLR